MLVILLRILYLLGICKCSNSEVTKKIVIGFYFINKFYVFLLNFTFSYFVLCPTKGNNPNKVNFIVRKVFELQRNKKVNFHLKFN